MTMEEYFRREKQLRNPDPWWWLPWVVVAVIVAAVLLILRG